MAAPSEILRRLTQTWVKKLAAAVKYKERFTEDAKEASNFFDGQHNWMWQDAYARGESGYNKSIAPPSFRIQVNKVFELVDIYSSVMYHRNPVRTVSVMNYPDLPPTALGIDVQPGMVPDMLPPEQQQILQVAVAEGRDKLNRQAIAELMEGYLNVTPQELDLKTQGQKWVRESLIKGMGVMWTELVQLDTSGDETQEPINVIGSFYDSIDNFLMDGDWENMDDILWCAKRCIQPVDVVAQEYGIPEDQLRKHIDQSSEIKLYKEGRSSKRGKKSGVEQTNELITYYKIWTKCGFGDRLKDAPKEFRGMFDNLGKYCYLVIAEGIDYPLNVPPSVLEQYGEQAVDGMDGAESDMLTRVAWPIPFYCDNNGWPFTPLYFHWKPGYAYPISHIRPAIGELRLLNWAMSFLATRIATSCETIVAVQKAADETIKDQILAPSEGGFKMVEISELLGRGIGDVVSVFQMPQVTKDLWDIIAAISQQFAERTGLTELVYGYTRSSFRSASEAQIKQENISIRPDAMANQLEDAMSLLARREALAARWLLEPKDLAPFVGQIGALAWQRNIATRSLASLSRDFIYRVEAGSARKPNKSTRVEQMQMAVQTLGPIVSNLIGAGIVEPFNALMRDWADSLDIDASPYLVPPPAPPAAPPPGPPPGPGEERAAEGAGGTQPEEEGPPPDGVPPELAPQA